ncbi:hypothetical protein F0562_035921 [Nyssa sinensis]|uniref:Uncharacterized protein n=1 Tax=Nyssa sinensis TaxID=561372 RepID=A0A5J5AFS8_9ASTE|nr:hypothetical protein F0562_035921 [Nyssa sinensis]
MSLSISLEKVVLEEEQTVWEMGKVLGLSYEEVISKLVELEEQDQARFMEFGAMMLELFLREINVDVFAGKFPLVLSNRDSGQNYEDLLSASLNVAPYCKDESQQIKILSSILVKIKYPPHRFGVELLWKMVPTKSSWLLATHLLANQDKTQQQYRFTLQATSPKLAFDCHHLPLNIKGPTF